MCIYIIVIIYKIPWISIYWIDKYIYTPIYTKWKGWFNQRPQQQQQRVLEGYHGEMGSIDLENPQFRKMMEMWSIGGFWTDLYIIYSSLASLSQFVVHPSSTKRCDLAMKVNHKVTHGNQFPIVSKSTLIKLWCNMM